MKLRLGLVLAVLALGGPAFAGIVTFEGTHSTVAGVGVASQAKVTVGDETLTLPVSGAGIRKKVKAFLTFNVYVAASYVTDLPALRRAATPIEGIRSQQAKVIKLTMLRSLSAQEVKAAFQESLRLNNVDLNTPAIKDLFKAWTQGLDAGQTAVMVGIGTDKLVIELPGKTLSSEGQNLSLDFWKIWFAQGDDLMKVLQVELVGKDE